MERSRSLDYLQIYTRKLLVASFSGKCQQSQKMFFNLKHYERSFRGLNTLDKCGNGVN